MKKEIVDNPRSYDFFISEIDTKELLEYAIAHLSEGNNFIKIKGITYEFVDDYNLYAIDDCKLMLNYCN